MRITYQLQRMFVKIRNSFDVRAWTVLALVASSPWATFKNIPIVGYPIPFLLAGIIAVAIVMRCIQLRDVYLDPPIIVLLAFCAVIACSYGWTLKPEFWRRELFWWVICLFSFAGTLMFLKNVKQLAYAAIAAAVITFPMLRNDLYSLGAHYAVVDHNANLTAYALMACLYIVFAAIHSSNLSRAEEYAFLAAIALIGVELFMLASRGSLIAFTCVCIAALLIDRLPRWLILTIPAALVFGAFVTSFGMLNSLMSIVDVGTSKQAVNESPRSVVWGEAKALFLQYPFLGVGPGTFPSLSRLGINAHNSILNIATSVGLIGFSVYAAFWVIHTRRVLSFRGGAEHLLLFAAFAGPIMLTGYVDTIPILWVAIATPLLAVSQRCEN